VLEHRDKRNEGSEGHALELKKHPTRLVTIVAVLLPVKTAGFPNFPLTNPLDWTTLRSGISKACS
jgi:hypothetical protein